METLIKKNYRNHKEVIHNFMWRALQAFAKQGVTFLIFILCAKLLTPYDFGIYNYTLAVIFLLIMFGDFGISTAISKYVAEFNETDKEKLKLILPNSLFIIIIFAGGIAAFTLLFSRLFLGDKYGYIIYVLPLLFLAPISSLYDGVFRGLKRFKELAIISLLVSIPSVFFVYFLVRSFGLVGALVSQSLFYFILVLLLSFVYKNFHFQIDKKIIKMILSYSFAIGISSIAYFLYTRVDILILGYFGYVKEIGYYELVTRSFELMFLPFALFAQVISPSITVYFARKDYSMVREKLYFFMRLIIPLAIIVAILFYFIAPQIIKVFLPEYYTAEMFTVVAILSFLVPTKIWGVFQTQSFIVATGYAKIVAITTLIGGILNIIFDIIFINWIGFEGVFLVTLAIHSFNILFVTVYYWFNLRKISIL
jgi:O-antigen/teichoic acid export membrane protein